jgi:predicted nucleic acid-binding protein
MGTKTRGIPVVVIGGARYLIAATAEEEAATLVTLDVKHFPMIEGLRAPW